MPQTDFLEYLDFGPKNIYRRLDIDSLEALAELAFSEIAFKMPQAQAQGFAAIIGDPLASDAERFVATSLLRNAAIAASGILPVCQDTGTALVYGWKGNAFPMQEKDDALALARGAARAYAKHRLRASQLGPIDMLSERNTGDNLPAYIDLRLVPGSSYRCVFAAKGGGSTSRTSLSMESPAILDKDRLDRVLASRIQALGASACPPYTIVAVLGGAAPSQTLYAMELAALGLLDTLPAPATCGAPLRDRDWEERMAASARATGIGAQWGGSRMAMTLRAIRLPRHAANLPLAVGVSCAANRHARAYIDASGWYLERMESDPGRFLPSDMPIAPDMADIDLDTRQDLLMDRIRSLKAGTLVCLSGTVVVARDAAHARIARALAQGQAAPEAFGGRAVFYAGPTEAALGASSGAFGPTTAARMDSYLASFMNKGLSLLSIGKGGRSAEAACAIKTHKGAYLAVIGGAAALAARDHVVESRVVAYPDLGMEAIRLVRLHKLPAIIAIDASGTDIYAHS